MKQTTTLFLGDSIVKGIAPENGKYRVLDTSYFNTFSRTIFSSAVNKGRFGLTSTKFLNSIERLHESNADIIFFSIGGNDCNYNWKEIAEHPGARHLPAVSKELFEENLIKIYDFFLANNMNVIAMNFPPLHAEKFFSYLSMHFSGESILSWLGNISKIHYHHESYNTIFETVTRTYGVDLIDIRRRFLQEDNLDLLMSIDGMHPSQEGHELIYRSISSYLLFQAIQLGKTKQQALNRIMNPPVR